MKLVISIVQEADAEDLIEEVTRQNFRVTKMSSSGGFLKSGNITLLTGVEDEEVNELISIIKNNCKTREVTKIVQTMNIPGQAIIPTPITVNVGGAAIFVLNVEDFRRY